MHSGIHLAIEDSNETNELLTISGFWVSIKYQHRPEFWI